MLSRWLHGGNRRPRNPPNPENPPTLVPSSIVISPTPFGLEEGGTFQLTATVRDQLGNIRTGDTVDWATDDAGVATVNSSGLVTGVASGTCSISASVSGYANVTAPADCTVSAASVATLGVSPTSLNLTEGVGTGTLTFTPRDASGNALTGRTVTVQSNDTNTATIGVAGYTGTVTPVAAGSTTVYGTCETINSANVTVAVSAVSGGADPYEPSGYSQIAARPFSAANEDSWSPVFNGGVYLTTDATAPTSPSSVFQFIKNTGTSTAFAPGTIEKTIAEHTAIYCRVAIKLSAAYYGNSSLINKLGPFFGVQKGNQMFLFANGAGANTLYLRMAAQGCPPNLGPMDASGGASFGGNTYPLTRDRWYIVRMHLVVNTFNVADGILQVWVEDTTTGVVTQLVNRSNMAYIGTGTQVTTTSNSKWDRSYLNAIHGGGAELPATDTRIFIDDYYASAP